MPSLLVSKLQPLRLKRSSPSLALGPVLVRL